MVRLIGVPITIEQTRNRLVRSHGIGASITKTSAGIVVPTNVVDYTPRTAPSA